MTQKPAIDSAGPLFFCMGYLSLAPWTMPTCEVDHVSYYMDNGMQTWGDRGIEGLIQHGFSPNFLLVTAADLNRVDITRPVRAIQLCTLRFKMDTRLSRASCFAMVQM
jgi:hypothetical protein